MIPLSDYLNNSIQENLENRLYYLFAKFSEDEIKEPIEREKVFHTTGVQFRADFYFEKGIKKLGFPAKTVVEVVEYLEPRNLTIAYRTFSKIKDQIGKFILIYHKTNFSAPPSSPTPDSKFQLIDDDSFHYWHRSDNKKKNSSDSQNKVEEKDKNRAHGNDGVSQSKGNLNTPSESNPKVGRVDKVDISDWIKKREILIEDLKTILSEETTALFLGAGVSASAKMPSWNDLLLSLLTHHAKENNPEYLDCDLSNVLKACGNSNLIAARYIEELLDTTTMAKVIQQALYANKQDSTLIKSICRLVKDFKIEQIITFNYDQLIEKELKTIGMSPYSVTHHGMIPKGKLPVYHVHGSVNDPDNPIELGVPDAPVLSEENYHTLYSTGHHWSNTAILHALQHSHCIFIGLSMTDPNLRRLLEVANKVKGDTSHYVFLARSPLYQGYYDNDPRNVKHYELQEKMMRSLGIEIVWYEIDNQHKNPHHKLEELIDTIKTTL